MKTIIARLEEARSRAAALDPTRSGPSAFAAQKSMLQPPFRGKIIDGFGQHVDPVTRLKSFSPGITIKGQAHGTVRSVASGTVAYCGSLRGYGNFVIINHDHQYYTTYAGLGEILVSDGQFLRARARLGTAGKDGVVKFELRNGHEPLDPVKWIKIESL
jgi:murein DD-endopeptidase MepM/ murein hydrolase activator NlpD